MRIIACLALTALTLTSVQTLYAQEPPPPDVPHPVAEEAISKLRSPFCPGLMLEVCPTRDADALRDSLQAGASAGASADDLVERVVAAYGEEYRAFPKPEGAGLVAWIMPPIALALGLALLVLALRRLKGSAPDFTSEEKLADEDIQRLDEALAELEALEGAEA